jgi:hypothetical protein
MPTATKPAPADLIEVYTDKGDEFQQAVAEWRDSQRVERVRTFKRTVRAAGASTEVYVVCVWYTVASRVHGWNG